VKGRVFLWTTDKYVEWSWVPSQSGTGVYQVDFSTEAGACTCADFKAGTVRCKHIYAASYARIKEKNTGRDAAVNEELKAITAKRQTYPQVWPAYNRAQTNEKDQFQKLLHTLCEGVKAPKDRKKGRPSLPLRDALFSCTFKVYSTVSARRFMSDLRVSNDRGFISKTPHYNSIINYLENPALFPILKALVEQSSRPLRTIDDAFAVDSTGFMACRFTRWFDHKYGKPREEHDWVKCHIACGVKTNVVTAVEIGTREANDAPFLPALVQSTAQNFKVGEVSADKAYGGRKNVEAIEAAGGAAFIAVKSNATGEVGGGWEKMVKYFKFRQDEFLGHYHKRSNVESTFSMIKRKFGDSLRSRTDVAMINETLCKLLCHNLVVLIHEMHELGIDPMDWGSFPVPKKIVVSEPGHARESVVNLSA
jgi:transposase